MRARTGLRREQGFDGDAANIHDFNVDAVFIEELFVFSDPERQHRAADGAVSDPHGRGCSEISGADRHKER